MKGRESGRAEIKTISPSMLFPFVSAACLSVFSNEHGIPANGNEWLAGSASSAFYYEYL